MRTTPEQMLPDARSDLERRLTEIASEPDTEPIVVLVFDEAAAIRRADAPDPARSPEITRLFTDLFVTGRSAQAPHTYEAAPNLTDPEVLR